MSSVRNGIGAPATHCRVPDCMAATTGRKPYCFDHVRRMPYLAHVAGEVARREEEAAHVARGGDVDVRGLRAQELEWFLLEGPLGLQPLMRLSELPRRVLCRYLRALERAGTIVRHVERTERKRARTSWASSSA